MSSIGVDIGGSHITACKYDLQQEKLDDSSLVYRKIDPKGSKSEILGGWVEALKECQGSLSSKITGIGIAMPGPFDYYNGISLIKDLDKLNALYEANIRLELAERLKLQPSQIRFINDATAFSIAEAKVGCARNFKRVVAITLGTGLGASFLIEGKPILRDKSVPEGGFLYNQFYRNEIADNVFSTRGILRRYREISGKEVQNVRILSEMAEKDSQAKQCFIEFGDDLGEFLDLYLRAFNADAVVLGGNISKAFPLFGQSLIEKLGKIEIIKSNLGEKAAIIGSALLLDDDYYSEISSTLKLM